MASCFYTKSVYMQSFLCVGEASCWSVRKDLACKLKREATLHDVWRAKPGFTVFCNLQVQQLREANITLEDRVAS